MRQSLAGVVVLGVATPALAQAEKPLTIGVIELFPNPHFAHARKGIEDFARKNNTNVIIQNANLDATKEAQFIFVADEVMTGWGRTGTLFACEQAGFTPDIACYSKGLTGGSLPLAVTLCHADIFDAHYSTDRTKTFSTPAPTRRIRSPVRLPWLIWRFGRQSRLWSASRVWPHCTRSGSTASVTTGVFRMFAKLELSLHSISWQAPPAIWPTLVPISTRAFARVACSFDRSATRFT
jgi:hypothetical protein